MVFIKFFKNTMLSILLISGTATYASTESTTNIDDFFYKLFLSETSRNPQKLSRLGYFESKGIYGHNAYLNDVSPKGKSLDFEEKNKDLQLLKKYSTDSLSREQKTSYKTILWGLENAIRGEKFLFHEYYVSHEFGILSDLTEVFTLYHPLKTREYVNLYITRLSHISEQLEQSITLLEHQKEMGIITPAFSLSHVINMIQELMPRSITKDVFYNRLATAIETIETPDKEKLLAQAATVIKTSVYPAFQKLQQYLKTLLSKTTTNNSKSTYQRLKGYLKTLLSQTATNDGVWSLPNGDEYYAYKLKCHTTTDLTADQIHELGQQEVQKIQEEMRKVFKEAHLNDDNKSVAQLTQKLLSFFKLSFLKDHYLPTEKGRKQCLADYEAILERSRKELSHLFNIKPKSSVRIQAVPKHEEENAQKTPHYLHPSIDGSRPGVFFVNLGFKGLLIAPKFAMESIVVHEAEPGHHFQLALQQESNIPLLRKLETDEAYTAYCEGWALYIEKLAYEQNFYSSKLSRLGHLGFELLRAARLVVDTGIHKKKWTKEQAIKYMVETTGFPKLLIVDEVERYFVDPGQACAYKIGQLKILELRKRAKDTLGKKFDIRKFHDVILKTGETPLPILEEVVNEYIQDELKD
jgi:uncharacterized protein (DUF885 family)